MESIEQDKLLRALKEIAALDKVTEIRGPLETIGVPEHKIKKGGWVPIRPAFAQGLQHAARIAQAALADYENLHTEDNQ